MRTALKRIDWYEKTGQPDRAEAVRRKVSLISLALIQGSYWSGNWALQYEVNKGTEKDADGRPENFETNDVPF